MSENGLYPTLGAALAAARGNIAQMPARKET
jgi:hypothetical protein